MQFLSQTDLEDFVLDTVPRPQLSTLWTNAGPVVYDETDIYLTMQLTGPAPAGGAKISLKLSNLSILHNPWGPPNDPDDPGSIMLKLECLGDGSSNLEGTDRQRKGSWVSHLRNSSCWRHFLDSQEIGVKKEVALDKVSTWRLRLRNYTGWATLEIVSAANLPAGTDEHPPPVAD